MRVSNVTVEKILWGDGMVGGAWVCWWCLAERDLRVGNSNMCEPLSLFSLIIFQSKKSVEFDISFYVPYDL